MENILSGIIEGLKVQPPCLAPDVDGWTSPRVRMLLNRLVGALAVDESYFEIGCLKGATLISALLDHPSASAVACDNWSQLPQDDPEQAFWKNLKAYGARLPEIMVRKTDCFKLVEDPPFKSPIGVYFYDGDHSFESQSKAVTVFAPFLAKRSVVIVDDWNWERVRSGTWAGIHAVRPRRVEFWELPARFDRDTENFWNGIGAFHIEKA